VSAVWIYLAIYVYNFSVIVCLSVCVSCVCHVCVCVVYKFLVLFALYWAAFSAIYALLFSYVMNNQ